MSQHDLHAIIRQQQEQLAAMQVQIQALLAAGGGGTGGEERRTTGLKVEVAVTNFIQLVSSQLVDRFSQTKLRWKAPNEGYLHMCRMHKSDNK